MYKVNIINNNEVITINEASIDIDSPKIIGNIKKGINTIDSFTFSILTNNPGYNKIYPKKTRIEITNVLLNSVEFRGRVLLSNPKMDDKGLFSEEVTCESELGYLHDSKQRYAIYSNITPTELLKRMLSKHNETVEDYKKFYLGIVEIEDNKPNEISLDYNSTFDSIREHLIERLGGEIRVRYEGKKLYLDYLKSIGSKKDTEISLSKNLKTIELEKDPTNIITKLIPLGSKLEDSEERINISKVNNGLDYIIDEVAKEQFGINEDVITFDNITSEYELFKAGQSYLKENNRILKKYKVDALDLSLIGLDINSYEVGNSYKVINPIMNINEYIRIIEKNIDIREPQNSSLTIGDKFEDIKKYQSDLKRESKQLKVELVKSNTEIKKNKKVIEKVDVEVKENTKAIKTTETNITSINQEIKTINDKLGSINSKDEVIDPVNIIPFTNFEKPNNYIGMYKAWGGSCSISMVTNHSVEGKKTPNHIYVRDIIPTENNVTLGVVTPICIAKLKAGKRYTLSFKAMSRGFTNHLDYIYIMSNETGVNNQSIVNENNRLEINTYGNFDKVSYITFIPTRDYDNASFLIGRKDTIVASDKVVAFALWDIKCEPGSKVTSWVPNIIDTDTDIININENISVIEKDIINLKSDKADVAALNKVVNDVDNNKSNITVIKTDINNIKSNKADKSDLNKTIQDVNVAKSDIVVLKSDVNNVKVNKADKTDITALNNNKLNVTTFNEKVDIIYDDVNSIAGVNLLENSTFKSKLANWTGWSDKLELALYKNTEGKQCVRVYAKDATITTIALYYQKKHLNFIAGRKYSLSFKFRSYYNMYISKMTYNYIIHSTGNKAFSRMQGYSFSYDEIGGGYYIIKITFIPDQNYIGAGILIGSQGLTDVVVDETGFGVSEVMLQESNTPSNWTESPSDIEGEIANLKSNTDNSITKINVDINTINTNKANKSDVYLKTQTYSNTEINNKLTPISESISNIEYIQNTSGFNLLPNSNWAKGCNYGWRITGTPTKHFLSGSSSIEDSNSIQLGTTGALTGNTITIDSPKIFITPSKPITFSSIGTAGANAQLRAYLLFTNNSEDITINNEYLPGYKYVTYEKGKYTKLSIVDTPPNGCNYCFIRIRVSRENLEDNTNLIGYINSMNVVNGTKSIRWTPCQLDGYLYTEYKFKNMLEESLNNG